jgi:DNA-binding LytR/AlgR family response regulator
MKFTLVESEGAFAPGDAAAGRAWTGAREFVDWLGRQGTRPIVVLVEVDHSPAPAPATVGRAEPLRWLTPAVGRTVRLIHVDDVCYFQSDGKYTRVVTANAQTLVQRSLREIRSGLDASVFWCIHRSIVVNAKEIAGVVRDDGGRMKVTLKRRSETLPVSERHQHLFRRM